MIDQRKNFEELPDFMAAPLAPAPRNHLAHTIQCNVKQMNYIICHVFEACTVYMHSYI